MENLINKNILECAKHLLKNTKNIYIQDELKWFIYNFPFLNEEENIYSVLKFIVQDGYNVKDFCLWEIPHPQVYTFVNENSYDEFDIYIDNFNGNGNSITAGFVNADSLTEDARSIADAIMHNRRVKYEL